MAATASMAAPSPASGAGSAAYTAGPTAKRTKAIRVPPRISLADLTHNNIGTLRKLNSVLFPVAYSDKFYKEVLSPELADYCQLVYYNDIPVGAITCRIERDPVKEPEDGGSDQSQSTGRLYLMTLGVLAPYRRQGLATKLVSHVYEKATEASLAASLTPPPQPVKEQPKVEPKSLADKKNKGKGKAAAASATSTPAAAESAKGEAPPAPPAPILKCIFVHVQTNNDDAKTFWELQGFKEKEVIKDYYKPTIEGPRDAWLLQKEIDV